MPTLKHILTDETFATKMDSLIAALSATVVPTSRTIAGLPLSNDITSAALIDAIGDATPIENSTNLVESGGVYTQLALKLPTSTKYGAGLSLSIDTSTYTLTVQLKDQDGNNIGNSQSVDLPLESVIVDGRYDSETKMIILELQNGNEIEVSVADLVSGLQDEITENNKLDADLVDDSTSINKFVTSNEKSTWNGKLDALVSGTNIKTINNTSLLGNGNININWGDITGTLANLTDLNNALSGKLNTIDSSHKLSSDNVDDTNSTNKFVTSADKDNWNNKRLKTIPVGVTNSIASVYSDSGETPAIFDLSVSGSSHTYYLGQIKYQSTGSVYNFEFQELVTGNRYKGTVTGSTNITVCLSSTYSANYALDTFATTSEIQAIFSQS